MLTTASVAGRIVEPMPSIHTANVSVGPRYVVLPHVCAASQCYHRRGNDGDEPRVLRVDGDLHSDDVLSGNVLR